MIKYLIPILVTLSLGFGEPVYIDGILVDPDGTEPVPAQDFVIIKSFPSNAPSYSMGLAFDGQYLWNDEAFSKWFARVDTASGNAVNTFTPANGNRDMTFDGQYLWATDWQTYMVYKYDTSNCSILSSFNPPFSGHADGMAWDGNYLWVGEENGQIYQLDTTGSLIKSIPSPNSSGYNPRGLAYDGEYLWVGAQTVGLIYQIDTTGTVIASYSAPSGGLQQGLTYDGVYLWSTGGNNMIYQIDISPRVEEVDESVIDNIFIRSNPSVFSNRTRISFGIPTESEVRISIIDRTGRIAKNVVTQIFTPGNYQINWDRGNLPPGIYFAVMKTKDRTAQTKLIVLD